MLKRITVNKLRLQCISSRHKIYKTEIMGEAKVLKPLSVNQRYNENIIYTLDMLANNRAYFSSHFCLPDYLVNDWSYTFPYLNGFTNFSQVLNNRRVPFEEKIALFKKFGSILRECETLRNHISLRNFAIGDIHEDNIMVDLTRKKVVVIDLDSCRIGTNYSSFAKYLLEDSLAADCPKYHFLKTEFNNFEFTSNTDLFCYGIMFLNFLGGANVQNFSLDKYDEFISYLRKIGLNYELVLKFYQLVSSEHNSNFDYLLDSVTKKEYELVHESKFASSY